MTSSPSTSILNVQRCPSLQKERSFKKWNDYIVPNQLQGLEYLERWRILCFLVIRINDPKSYEIEGHTMNIPHMFKGQNYDYWKQRMMAFFDACHVDMWDVVENDNYIPTNKEGAEIQRSSWNEE
ncbi:hypothetical protein CR513_14364, partial [Mucuna pruriens]